MSFSNFRDFGKSLALIEMGVPISEHTYFLTEDVSDEERARLAINFCKEASDIVGIMGEQGPFARVLLEKIATTKASELDPVVIDFVLDQAANMHALTKQSGIVGGTAAAAANYVPSLIKSFIALAAGGGAALGAGAWAGRHALAGPDEDQIAELEAGIKEYHKLRGRVAREKRNNKIEEKYL